VRAVSKAARGHQRQAPPIPVTVLDGSSDLRERPPGGSSIHLVAGQFAHQGVKRAAARVLHDEVQVLLVLEHLVQSDHVLMLEGGEDEELARHALHLSDVADAAFLNAFDCDLHAVGRRPSVTRMPLS
jgi:hypothetical protein